MTGPDQVSLEIGVWDLDLGALQARISRPENAGIRFTTLADEQRARADWLTRLCEVDNATGAGDPNVPRTVEQMAERMRDLRVVAEAVIIAKRGPDYVGYTCLDPKSSDGVALQQSWTGVRPSYRRRGIGTALKVQGIAYARAHGYRRIITQPRRSNAASIGMSLKIGYEPAALQDGTPVPKAMREGVSGRT